MRKLYFFLIVFLSMIINSCELDINKDPNYPDAVSADKYISSGIMWTTSAVGGDLQLLGRNVGSALCFWCNITHTTLVWDIRLCIGRMK